MAGLLQALMTVLNFATALFTVWRQKSEQAAGAAIAREEIRNAQDEKRKAIADVATLPGTKSEQLQYWSSINRDSN